AEAGLPGHLVNAVGTQRSRADDLELLRRPSGGAILWHLGPPALARLAPIPAASVAIVTQLAASVRDHAPILCPGAKLRLRPDIHFRTSTQVDPKRIGRSRAPPQPSELLPCSMHTL